SGTEEQYNELDQLLQEVSDMAHEFGYAPRTVPRKGSAAAPCKRVLAAPFSAAAEMRSAHNLRDEALLSMGTEGGQADDGVMSDCGGSAASRMLMSLCNLEEEAPLSPQSPRSVRTEHVPADSASDDAAAMARQPEPQPRQGRKKKRAQNMPKGIQGLQGMGLELLARREEYEFLLKKEKLALAKRQLELDERKLALEERKVSIDEERHVLQMNSCKDRYDQLLERMQRIEDLLPEERAGSDNKK
ncbi:hypothetical protein V5799_022086, partial [Amblyomma americanum]